MTFLSHETSNIDGEFDQSHQDQLNSGLLLYWSADSIYSFILYQYHREDIKLVCREALAITQTNFHQWRSISSKQETKNRGI